MSSDDELSSNWEQSKSSLTPSPNSATLYFCSSMLIWSILKLDMKGFSASGITLNDSFANSNDLVTLLFLEDTF